MKRAGEEESEAVDKRSSKAPSTARHSLRMGRCRKNYPWRAARMSLEGKKTDGDHRWTA